MGIEKLKQCEEVEEGGDGPFPAAEKFNAAITEASADIDPDNFDEDFKPLEDEDSHETKFETLPEMEIIHHNLGF